MKHIFNYPLSGIEELDELQKYARQPITKQEYDDLARFLEESIRAMPQICVLSLDSFDAISKEYGYRKALCEKLHYIAMNMKD